MISTTQAGLGRLVYGVVQKNVPSFEIPRLISAEQNGQPMHSQLALTEHGSLNLAPLILLDPVHEIIFISFVSICRECAWVIVGPGPHPTALLICNTVFLHVSSVFFQAALTCDKKPGQKVETKTPKVLLGKAWRSMHFIWDSF